MNFGRKKLHNEALPYDNCIPFLSGQTHQMWLMHRVNFRRWCRIGNTSAPLHLSLRSWLLKVDSKQQLCWLSACLYIRTQIVGRLAACCYQRNKSCPWWPHLLVSSSELWTVMSFIWAVCHWHFLSQVPPLSSPAPSCPYAPCVFSPYPKEILSRNHLFCLVTHYAAAFVLYPLWVSFSSS